MKIRTGFVTNCSSSSSAEIVIDNPVLLKILQRYKDLGLFYEGKMGYEVGSYGTEGNPSVGDTKTPAFYLTSDYEFDTPQSLSEILGGLIDVMDQMERSSDFFGVAELDENLFNQMKYELTIRKEEINDEFISVRWGTWRFMNSGSNRERHFHFNQISGESYKMEQEGKDDDFDNW